jgi:hypothetical protein
MQDRRIVNILDFILKALSSNLDNVRKTKLYPTYPSGHAV